MSTPKDTDVFAATLAENFRDVRYDEKKRTGTATIPNVGTIEFREPSNDPGVIVQLLYTKRFKGSAESALDFIEILRNAWENSD